MDGAEASAAEASARFMGVKMHAAARCWIWLRPNLVLLLLLAGAGSAAAQSTELGLPLTGLTTQQLNLFQLGLQAFDREHALDPGFGPEFNGMACGMCHKIPAVGGSGSIYNNVLLAGFLDTQGRFQAGAGRQSPIVHSFRHGDGPLEPIPPGANVLSQRVPRPLFGLGLVEAIPDAQLMALADPDDSDGDGISGRAVREYGRVVRFGTQSQGRSIRSFVERAFELEMGLGPDERNPVEVDSVVDFVTLLEAPPRAELTPYAVEGERIFGEIGCADCHRASYKLPKWPYTTLEGEVVDVRAMRSRVISPYSDFLLHDMGPMLDDGVSLGQAQTYEYRTPPLWGLRFNHLLLHDGRVFRPDQALHYHGGEAAAARDAFLALDALDRAYLSAFLGSL